MGKRKNSIAIASTANMTPEERRVAEIRHQAEAMMEHMRGMSTKYGKDSGWSYYVGLIQTAPTRDYYLLKTIVALVKRDFSGSKWYSLPLAAFELVAAAIIKEGSALPHQPRVAPPQLARHGTH